MGASNIQKKGIELEYAVIDALRVGVPSRSLEWQMVIVLEFTYLAAKCNRYMVPPDRVK